MSCPRKENEYNPCQGWIIIELLIPSHLLAQDSTDDSPTDPQDVWCWPWMQDSISQRLTFTLIPEHDGMILKCQVSHVALKDPLEVSEKMGHIVPTTAESTFNTVEVASCQECPKECPGNNELNEVLLRETRARASLRDIEEETTKRSLEAAKSYYKAADAEAIELEAKRTTERLTLDTARFTVRLEEAMAKNAEEELEFQRERRRQGHHLPQTCCRCAAKLHIIA